MPKNITVTVPTAEDVKDVVNDTVEDVQETVTEFRENTEEKVNALNPTQKVLLLTGGVVVVTTLVQVLINRFRKPVVVEGDVVVNIDVDEVEDELLD
jgi:hypothetical protein